jgi:ABC-2 type transport system ATP-binding protein
MTGMVTTRALSKQFRGETVLEDLNLDVAEGSVFGLIGPNGAGKTTTIKILMNILEPSMGRAEVLGVDSRQLTAPTFTKIGYVSENQEMPDWMTVDYFLTYCKGFYPTWDDTRAAELVRQLDLPGGRKLKHLSRGMRMKTALASSLAYHPRLLVLDEPFTGLDPLVRDEFIQGMIASMEETTILVSSHDLAEIENFATHIGYLERGRLQFSEEMTSLSDRFREVEVTVEPPARMPSADKWPETWLQPEVSQALVRFVDTHFETDRTSAEIRRVFGGVKEISTNPMPLRSIFVTLARASSKTA